MLNRCVIFFESMMFLHILDELELTHRGGVSWQFSLALEPKRRARSPNSIWVYVYINRRGTEWVLEHPTTWGIDHNVIHFKRTQATIGANKSSFFRWFVVKVIDSWKILKATRSLFAWWFSLYQQSPSITWSWCSKTAHTPDSEGADIKLSFAVGHLCTVYFLFFCVLCIN